MASALGVGFGAGMRGRRTMIERHLRRVDPKLRGNALRRAVQSAFDYYARYWVESFRLPGLSAAEVDAAFSYEGLGYVDDALSAGLGVIIALPHLGGWEWAGRWIADQGLPITVVVEPLEPPELFEWFVSFRESLGMTVVPVGASAAAAVSRALRANEVVCLLSDRDIQGGGIEVEFFGERTTLPGGPATLGLRTGAPVLPTAVYFTSQRDGHHAIIRPPVPSEREGSLRDDVTRITQLLARRAGGAHPRRTTAVAPLPTQLAVRPGLRALTKDRGVIVGLVEVEVRHSPSFAVARLVLDPDEQVRGESGVMMATSAGVSIEASTQGGVMKGLKRSFLGGESLFITTFTAPSSGGGSMSPTTWPVTSSRRGSPPTSRCRSPRAAGWPHPGDRARHQVGWLQESVRW